MYSLRLYSAVMWLTVPHSIPYCGLLASIPVSNTSIRHLSVNPHLPIPLIGYKLVLATIHQLSAVVLFLSLWDRSLDIQLHHDSSSFSSRLQFQRGSFDAVEQHAISRILFSNSANASRKNNSGWCSNHNDLKFVFDSGENHLVPLRLDLDLAFGLLYMNYFFRPKYISTKHSWTTVGSATACHSIRSTVRSANYLSLKSYTTEPKHVISLLLHGATHVQNKSTFGLSFTILMPLSACPADVLSYAGLVLFIVRLPASLNYSPTLQLNATIGLPPSVRMITSR